MTLMPPPCRPSKIGWSCTVLFCDDNARFELVQRLMQQQRQLTERQRSLTESTEAARQQHAEAAGKYEESAAQADAAASRVNPHILSTPTYMQSMSSTLHAASVCRGPSHAESSSSS